ncbi:MAG: IS30 family transposase [Candidatus Dormibacteraeota bacterium]|nr:IS30 family transposase [Candidatus Dormibacteraeota bacterium]
MSGTKTRLGLEEREAISRGLAVDEEFAVIARRLRRPTSTVSREVGRSGGRSGYRAAEAHRSAGERGARPRRRKLVCVPELAAEVEAGLEKRWSPQQIAARLRVDHPDEPEARVSHETIYSSLYCQGRGGLRKELIAALRTGRARRRPRSRAEQARRGLPNMVNISERPPEAADRAVPGHWEGDLIMGAFNRSAIVTLIERQSRYCLLGDLPDGHTAEEVYACLVSLIATLPANLVRSLTWDQGREMAMHQQFSVDTGVDVYFCDPHSPWQRPTNENMNGLLRQYFPKGTDLNQITKERLDFVAAELNGRPRQVLDWASAAEVYSGLLVASAA